MAPLGNRPKRAGAGTGGLRAGVSTRNDTDEPSETAKKVKHLAKLLEGVAVAYSEDLAVAWIVPFNDEADPLFAIERCLNAGWRDPWLLGAAIGIFGSLDRAESCMEQLGIDLGSAYGFELVRLMLEVNELLQRAS